ncbi:MAG: GntR family transcriptional regulator [Chloroflexota bacterium]
MLAKNTIRPIEDHEKTISALVQERIRQAILEGTLPAGSRIDQAKLATDLKVSLVPVREALKTLEAEGFVQIIPRRGAFVTEISPDDIEALYFARKILESQTAYHAAEKLTEQDLATLTALMSQMSEALAIQDFRRFSALNRSFHFVIYKAADNRYLLNTIASLWELAERYRYRYLFIKNRAAIIQTEHQTILDACYAHDKDRLHEAIIYHMNQTISGIRAHLGSANTESGDL